MRIGEVDDDGAKELCKQFIKALANATKARPISPEKVRSFELRYRVVEVVAHAIDKAESPREAAIGGPWVRRVLTAMIAYRHTVEENTLTKKLSEVIE